MVCNWGWLVDLWEWLVVVRDQLVELIDRTKNRGGRGSCSPRAPESWEEVAMSYILRGTYICTFIPRDLFWISDVLIK